MAYYRTCPYCGSNNDPGEACDCRAETKKESAPAQRERTQANGYLAQAKLHEAEGKTIPSLQQQVADLETDKAALTEKVTSLEGQVTDTQMALCDVYEQIVAVTSTTGGA